METAIHVSAAVLDARIDPKWSDLVLTSAFGALHRQDDRHGTGFLKGQWLLVIHKYGSRKDRDQLKTLGVNFVDDSQWRLHYLFVSLAIGVLKISDAGTASSLANSDIQLSIRLCGAAMSGRLSLRDLLLRRLVVRVNGKPGILGRHLPFLRLVLECSTHRQQNALWLKTALDRKGPSLIADQVVTDFLRRQYERLTG
jgi:hypothetical protein